MKYLITGSRGFIGSWICRLLAEEGVPAIAFDASSDDGRTRAALEDRHLRHVRFVTGDVTDAAQLRDVVADGVTHLINLAGFLRPASELQPARSMQVSVGGLLNVLDCARQASGQHLPVVFASTAAVYGPASMYPNGGIDEHSPTAPLEHYGTQRLAMELTARAYFRHHGVSSVGLRPWIVYGPGREHGLSASPSLAILAATARHPHRIRFGGTSVYQHVEDVARAFIAASRAVAAEPVMANIPGESFSMPAFMRLIAAAAPDGADCLSFEDIDFGTPSSVQDPTLARLTGRDDWGTAAQRVAETVRDYRQLLERGLVDASLLDRP